VGRLRPAFFVVEDNNNLLAIEHRSAFNRFYAVLFASFYPSLNCRFPVVKNVFERFFFS